MKHIIGACAFGLISQMAAAQDMVSYTTTMDFDDVTFGIENAITDLGLVVDNISHVGDMLERTREATGSDVVLFDAAEVYSFCSATLSRQVMEADPMNIVFCPYDIFVAQLPGSDEVTVGFRQYPEGAMQLIQTMLDGVVQEAIAE